MIRCLLFLLLLGVPLRAVEAPTGPDIRPIKQWLARQDDIHTLSADFVQTRTFRSLKNPLTNKGHFWFSAPGSFRWELGEPAKSIALKQGGTIFLIAPGKKKAERFAADSLGRQAGMKGMAMMDFPMAKTYADFDRQFEVLEVKVADEQCVLSVLPREQQARKFLQKLTFRFSTVNGQLMSFEMLCRDGSALRNDFENVRLNAKMERGVFDYDLTGYQIVDAKN